MGHRVQEKLDKLLELEREAWSEVLRYHPKAICQAMRNHISKLFLRGDGKVRNIMLDFMESCPDYFPREVLNLIEKYGLDGLIVRKALRNLGEEERLHVIKQQLAQVFQEAKEVIPYFLSVWGILLPSAKTEFTSLAQVHILRAIDRYQPAIGPFIHVLSSSMRNTRADTLYFEHTLLNVSKKLYHDTENHNKKPRIYSLDVETYGDDGKRKHPLRDFLAASDGNPEDLLIREEEFEGIRHALEVLDERERKILINLFGLNGATGTLRSLGEELGISHERVRQIKLRALQKLKNELVRRGLINDKRRGSGTNRAEV